MKLLLSLLKCLLPLTVLLGGIVYPEIIQAAVEESNAEIIVKNSPCLEGFTIEDALKEKIKIRSQRDLGWQVFVEDDGFEVERAFLMNKSMQLRFRWHIDLDGKIKPISSRAETLCIKEE